MNWSRPPAVSGTFYPDQESSLRSVVDALLKTAAGEGGDRTVMTDGTGMADRTGVADGSRMAESEPRAAERPKAIIAPHAGYVYSGPVAASAYVRLSSLRDRINRVVLLGPAHRYPFRGLAASSAYAFETPLGLVPLDREGIDAALALEHVLLLDQAHEGEHSLEVHLPFLQVVLGDFSLVPLVVGELSFGAVAQVLEALWGGTETLVVVSSDLSHFLPYSQANELDALTARAIQELRPEEIHDTQACGLTPMGGLLVRAREEGLSVECVDLRNSGDTAGPRNQVVGYGSFLFS